MVPASRFAPKFSCFSYNLGVMAVTYSSMTSNYYDYNITYTNNGATTAWANLIYPQNMRVLKDDIPQPEQTQVKYFAYEVLTTSGVAPLGGFSFSTIGGNTSKLLPGSLATNPNRFVNGVSFDVAMLYNGVVTNNLLRYSTGSGTTTESNSFVFPDRFIVINGWCIAGPGAYEGKMINTVHFFNPVTNALIGWLEGYAISSNLYAQYNMTYASYMPALMIDSTKQISTLRVYHTLPSAVITNLVSN
ncbi:Hypothetical protein, putative, partial [Bodo saltans]